jgi:hypothetical protein
MKVPELIRDHSSTIEILIKNGKAYWVFGLICTGIEVLGKCLNDDLPFNDGSVIRVEKTFNLAIDTLMPAYSQKK